MMKGNYDVLQEIKASIRDYEIATGLKCYLLNNIGIKVGDRNCYQCNHICEFIKKFDEHGECTHDYLGNCKPTLDTGEARFYRCPYGLLNIAIPILPDADTVYFASSGPILTDPPNRDTVHHFMDKNNLLNRHYDDVSDLLHGVPVLSDEQLYAISNTLQKTVLPIVSNNLDCFRTNKNRIKTITQELRQEANKGGDTHFKEKVYQLQKELELLINNTGGNKDDHSVEALNSLLAVAINGIFTYRLFDETKYRAAGYILALWQVSNDTDMDLDMIFGNDYKYVRDFLVIDTRVSLNDTVHSITERFKRAVIHGGKNKNNAIILNAMEYIRRHYANITMPEVASYVSLNYSYFSNLFKKETGQNYTEYLNKVRIDVSKQLLWENVSLTEIAYNVGFTDQSHFINVFKRYENISPSKWKQQQTTGTRKNSAPAKPIVFPEKIQKK